jgi:hypothetical protein
MEEDVIWRSFFCSVPYLMVVLYLRLTQFISSSCRSPESITSAQTAANQVFFLPVIHHHVLLHALDLWDLRCSTFIYFRSHDPFYGQLCRCRLLIPQVLSSYTVPTVRLLSLLLICFRILPAYQGYFLLSLPLVAICGHLHIAS